MRSLKLILAFGVAAIAFTAAAQAQVGGNEAWTEQQSSGNTMTITQSGQDGQAGFNGHRVLQNGTGNSLVINQGGTGNTVGDMLAPQATRPTGSFQQGNGNTLRIDQSGTGGSVFYGQNGNSNGNLAAGSYTASALPAEFGVPTYGAVTPTGLWNHISQTGTGSSAGLRQSGVGPNGAIIRQDGPVGARVTQTVSAGGSANLTYLDQSVPGTTASGTFATVTQRNIGAGGANLVDIRQYSAGATSNVDQRGGGNALFAYQTGGPNLIDTVQGDGTGNSRNGFISIVQTGAGGAANEFTARQYGDSQRVSARQSGNGNEITSTQNNGMGTGGNELTVLQIGNLNVADSFQSGSVQIAYVDQSGNSNRFTGSQVGTGNQLDVRQGLNGNVSFVNQAGSANFATVRQNR